MGARGPSGHNCEGKWFPGSPSLIEIMDACPACKRWLDQAREDRERAAIVMQRIEDDRYSRESRVPRPERRTAS